MSKEYTQEEITDRFMKQVTGIARYWGDIGSDPKKAAEGAIFSMLVLLDGESAGHPGCALFVNPHPDDKEYHIDNGEDYYPGFEDPDGSVRVKGRALFHDMLYGYLGKSNTEAAE